MPTPLTKPIARTVTTRREGVLVITLTDAGILVREKGRRQRYPAVAYGRVLLDAARLYVAEQKAAKAAARIARRVR